ncbi:MAG: methyltransferase domain-containing protein [Acidobacteriota bacterium]
MRSEILRLLLCPECPASPLEHDAFSRSADGAIDSGVAWCVFCRGWYPIEDAVLELLRASLAYAEDRDQFWRKHVVRMRNLGLAQTRMRPPGPHDDATRRQQTHFDWYAANEKQTYSTYETMPFWRAADALAFGPWREEIRPGRRLLDVACAQGRSTFPWMDLDLDIVAFDISKALIRQAKQRYDRLRPKARATFLVADAARFSFAAESFDYVLAYGVLHHMPDPVQTCLEIARVLRPGGTFFGSENNQTVFRKAFDFLQSLSPLWHEEAGEHPLISFAKLRRWLEPAGFELSLRTSVFLPPHVVNWFGQGGAPRLLRTTDHLATAIPLVRDQGGLILIRAEKTRAAARADSLHQAAAAVPEPVTPEGSRV